MRILRLAGYLSLSLMSLAYANSAPNVALTVEKKLVILGDSLTEGLGVAATKAYPALLEERINQSAKKWKVINAGVSGATTSSAPSQAKWLLRHQPNLMIIALGANDGLRGISPAQSKKNLQKAIETLKAQKIPVILAGVYIPPNYGENFSKQFNEMFLQLAKEQNIPLIPFLLKDVGGVASMNQSDGIHPNEKGHQKMAETVFESIKGSL